MVARENGPCFPAMDRARNLERVERGYQPLS